MKKIDAKTQSLPWWKKPVSSLERDWSLKRLS